MPLTYRKKYYSGNQECEYSDDYDVPKIGSFEKIIDLEKEVYMKIHKENMFLASESHQEASIMIKTFDRQGPEPFHDRGYYTNVKFPLRLDRKLNKNQTEFRVFKDKTNYKYYSSMQYSLIWKFPGISSQRTSDNQSVLKRYELWRQQYGGSVVDLQLRNTAKVSHCLYEYIQDRQLKRKFPSQPLDVPKPSNESIH